MAASRLTLDEAAAELRKTPRWLNEWLRTHPVDADGRAFYTTAGRDKVFLPSDITRIVAALREALECRSNSGNRAPAKRRTMKSGGRAEVQKDHSAWKQAAELLGDPTLLNFPGPSRNASPKK
jgi:hypothetical protein